MQPTVVEMVAQILRDCDFWPKEKRPAKLLPYLETYGRPLYDALMALPEADREACGVDKIEIRSPT